jgi:hypothetical protein
MKKVYFLSALTLLVFALSGCKDKNFPNAICQASSGIPADSSIEHRQYLLTKNYVNLRPELSGKEEKILKTVHEIFIQDYPHMQGFMEKLGYKKWECPEFEKAFPTVQLTNDVTEDEGDGENESR